MEESTKTYPDVVVCMLAYNLENYVSDAIDGVLLQDYPGRLTMVIGEDNSTDSTLAVCKEFELKYPDRIRILANEVNLGISENMRLTLNECKGEYVAFCEADDYWTDPTKISKQVEFLERHKEYSMVFQNFKYVFEDGSPSKIAFDRESQDYEFEDFVERRVVVATQTMLFRREAVPFLDEGTCVFDWLLLLLTSHHGKARYFDDVMSCYRQHSTNWTRKYDLPKAEFALEMTLQCKERFAPEQSDRFSRWVAHCYADVCFTSFEERNYQRFVEAWVDCKRFWNCLSKRTRRALRLRRTVIALRLLKPFAKGLR